MNRTAAMALAACLAITCSWGQNYTALPIDNPYSSTGQIIPLGASSSSGNFDESRSHFFWPAPYLPTAGGTITAIELAPSSSSTGALVYETLEISMDHTTNSGLSTVFANNLTNPQVVLSLSNQGITWAGGTWNTVALQTPFVYDGASNLVIQVRKVVDRVTNPPSRTFSHAVTVYPRRTDLVPPIWDYGVYGSGAAASPTARTTYSTEMLMRLQFGTASTLTIDSTRDTTGNSSRSYFHLGATITLTNQGAANGNYATFFETALLTSGWPLPPLNGEFWLQTPLYTLSIGSLDGAGRGVIPVTVPQDGQFIGVNFFVQSLLVGVSFDFTNVVVAPLAAY